MEMCNCGHYYDDVIVIDFKWVSAYYSAIKILYGNGYYDVIVDFHCFSAYYDVIKILYGYGFYNDVIVIYFVIMHFYTKFQLHCNRQRIKYCVTFEYLKVSENIHSIANFYFILYHCSTFPYLLHG